MADERDEEPFVVSPVPVVIEAHVHIVGDRPALDLDRRRRLRAIDRLDREQRTAVDRGQLAGGRRIVRGPEVDPAQARPRRSEVPADRIAGEERPGRVLQAPAEGQALAERHELGDRQVPVRLVEEGRVADDRPAGVGDQDDVVAAPLADPADGVGEARADDRGLDRVVEEHGQVAEGADELRVQAGQLGPIADRLDRYRSEGSVDRERRRRWSASPPRSAGAGPAGTARSGRASRSTASEDSPAAPKLGDLASSPVVPGLWAARR